MNVEKSKDPASGIVLRGMLMLGMVLVLVAGGYLLLLRRPTQALPETRLEPEELAAGIVLPQATFPATLDWMRLNKFAETLPSAPGWQIRYTAACNLARRGSEKVPWEIFVEILDEPRQMRNFRGKLKDGRVVPDEAAARQIILSGLRAVRTWHEKQENPPKTVPDQLKQVYASVDVLAESPFLELRSQAEKTRAAFFKS